MLGMEYSNLDLLIDLILSKIYIKNIIDKDFYNMYLLSYPAGISVISLRHMRGETAINPRLLSIWHNMLCLQEECLHERV